MDPELDVVALADRVAQRAGSRLNGGPAGPDPEGDGTAMGTGTGTGGDGEEVEELRMASPFCQGREDNFFSPQDVEIEKDDEDKVSEWRTSS